MAHAKHRLVLAALVACIACLALPADATARAPTLTSATASEDGHISATWELPPGVGTDQIEVSRRPDLAPSGQFADPERTNVLLSTETSWRSEAPFDAGTYFVHVSGNDNECEDCPFEEWSNVLQVDVPEPPPPPPPPPPPDPRPGLYAGPAGDFGARIRFRLDRSLQVIRDLTMRFTLSCRRGEVRQQIGIRRVRLRNGRFAERGVLRFTDGSREAISVSGELKPPDRATGRLKAVARTRALGRCRIFSQGRRGLRWTARRR